MKTSWKTTLGSLMTAISLIPSAIAELGLAEMSPTVQKVGIVCAFISFIWTGLKTKDHDVSGTNKEQSDSIFGGRPDDRR